MVKRIAMPKSWPLARKGKQKYVIEPRGAKESSIALLVVLRDLLGLVRTSREAEKILHLTEVKVNGKVVRDKSFPVHLFDIILLHKIKKYFILVFKGKKFALQEIKESEAGSKAYKVIGKKILRKGKFQLNLSQGVNLLVASKEAERVKVNDSVLVDLEQGKIIKHLPLREKSDAVVIGGKHRGEQGKIVKVEPVRNLVFVNTERGEIKVSKEKILVVAGD